MNEIKITFQSVCQLIQEKQLNMAENYVAIGYYLRKAKEEELYREGGYASIHEMASGEFGMARQTADHCMKINEKFSKGGDSPVLEESFRQYGKSQLQEMLYLTDEQMKDVRPDMTVKDIREIRKPAEVKPEKQEDKSLKGRKPTEEEKEILDVIARKLIGMYKRWMLEDFDARVMNVTTSYQELRNRFGRNGSFTLWFSGQRGLYHANLFEDYVQLWEDHDGCLGDIEPFYLSVAIQGMWNVIALEEAERQQDVEQQEAESEECSTSSEEPEEQIPGQDSVEAHPEWLPEGYESQPVIDGEYREVQQEEECSTSSIEEEQSDLDILREELRRNSNLLDIGLKELGPEDKHVRKIKLVVGALAAAICDLEPDEPAQEEPEQPELPLLKNNEQRKEWLRTYKDWGLWYRDEHIGVEYYKYDFENGARLIAEVYVRPIHRGREKTYESAYLHLVGGPEAPKGSYGVGKWQVNEQYNKYPDSETELVEFLKEVQRK